MEDNEAVSELLNAGIAVHGKSQAEESHANGKTILASFAHPTHHLPLSAEQLTTTAAEEELDGNIQALMGGLLMEQLKHYPQRDSLLRVSSNGNASVGNNSSSHGSLASSRNSSRSGTPTYRSRPETPTWAVERDRERESEPEGLFLVPPVASSSREKDSSREHNAMQVMLAGNTASPIFSPREKFYNLGGANPASAALASVANNLTADNALGHAFPTPHRPVSASLATDSDFSVDRLSAPSPDVSELTFFTNTPEESPVVTRNKSLPRTRSPSVKREVSFSASTKDTEKGRSPPPLPQPARSGSAGKVRPGQPGSATKAFPTPQRPPRPNSGRISALSSPITPSSSASASAPVSVSVSSPSMRSPSTINAVAHSRAMAFSSPSSVSPTKSRPLPSPKTAAAGPAWGTGAAARPTSVSPLRQHPTASPAVSPAVVPAVKPRPPSTKRATPAESGSKVVEKKTVSDPKPLVLTHVVSKVNTNNGPRSNSGNNSNNNSNRTGNKVKDSPIGAKNSSKPASVISTKATPSPGGVTASVASSNPTPAPNTPIPEMAGSAKTTDVDVVPRTTNLPSPAPASAAVAVAAAARTPAPANTNAVTAAAVASSEKNPRTPAITKKASWTPATSPMLASTRGRSMATKAVSFSTPSPSSSSPSSANAGASSTSNGTSASSVPRRAASMSRISSSPSSSASSSAPKRSASVSAPRQNVSQSSVASPTAAPTVNKALASPTQSETQTPTQTQTQTRTPPARSKIPKVSPRLISPEKLLTPITAIRTNSTSSVAVALAELLSAKKQREQHMYEQMQQEQHQQQAMYSYHSPGYTSPMTSSSSAPSSKTRSSGKSRIPQRKEVKERDASFGRNGSMLGPFNLMVRELEEGRHGSFHQADLETLHRQLKLLKLQLKNKIEVDRLENESLIKKLWLLVTAKEDEAYHANVKQRALEEFLRMQDRLAEIDHAMQQVMDSIAPTFERLDQFNQLKIAQKDAQAQVKSIKYFNIRAKLNQDYAEKILNLEKAVKLLERMNEKKERLFQTKIKDEATRINASAPSISASLSSSREAFTTPALAITARAALRQREKEMEEEKRRLAGMNNSNFDHSLSKSMDRESRGGGITHSLSGDVFSHSSDAFSMETDRETSARERLRRRLRERQLERAQSLHKFGSRGGDAEEEITASDLERETDVFSTSLDLCDEENERGMSHYNNNNKGSGGDVLATSLFNLRAELRALNEKEDSLDSDDLSVLSAKREGTREREREKEREREREREKERDSVAPISVSASLALFPAKESSAASSSSSASSALSAKVVLFSSPAVYNNNSNSSSSSSNFTFVNKMREREKEKEKTTVISRKVSSELLRRYEAATIKAEKERERDPSELLAAETGGVVATVSQKVRAINAALSMRENNNIITGEASKERPGKKNLHWSTHGPPSPQRMTTHSGFAEKSERDHELEQENGSNRETHFSSPVRLPMSPSTLHSVSLSHTHTHSSPTISPAKPSSGSPSLSSSGSLANQVVQKLQEKMLKKSQESSAEKGPEKAHLKAPEHAHAEQEKVLYKLPLRHVNPPEAKNNLHEKVEEEKKDEVKLQEKEHEQEEKDQAHKKGEEDTRAGMPSNEGLPKEVHNNPESKEVEEPQQEKEKEKEKRQEEKAVENVQETPKVERGEENTEGMRVSVSADQQEESERDVILSVSVDHNDHNEKNNNAVDTNGEGEKNMTQSIDDAREETELVESKNSEAETEMETKAERVRPLSKSLHLGLLHVIAEEEEDEQEEDKTLERAQVQQPQELYASEKEIVGDTFSPHTPRTNLSIHIEEVGEESAPNSRPVSFSVSPSLPATHSSHGRSVRTSTRSISPSIESESDIESRRNSHSQPQSHTHSLNHSLPPSASHSPHPWSPQGDGMRDWEQASVGCASESGERESVYSESASITGEKKHRRPTLKGLVKRTKSLFSTSSSQHNISTSSMNNTSMTSMTAAPLSPSRNKINSNNTSGKESGSFASPTQQNLQSLSQGETETVSSTSQQRTSLSSAPAARENDAASQVSSTSSSSKRIAVGFLAKALFSAKTAKKEGEERGLDSTSGSPVPPVSPVPSQESPATPNKMFGFFKKK